MCLMCDGLTFDDVIERLRGIVRQHGWALQGVEPPFGGVGWLYTVGLDPNYGHAELVIFDDDVRRGGELLNVLGRRVRDGEVFTAGETVCLGEHQAELIEVHTVHARGELLAQWHNLQRVEGEVRAAPDALQVIVPDLIAASGRRAMRTRLDVPFASLPA